MFAFIETLHRKQTLLYCDIKNKYCIIHYHHHDDILMSRCLLSARHMDESKHGHIMLLFLAMISSFYCVILLMFAFSETLRRKQTSRH
uniref:Uncharacterized protein n=1 Tax=Spodoptera frugiperda nuclear polyhedrosis virus TaxID=10455 RepID=A0A0R5RHU1_NPVSF|nr:hypothetical protein [Spodoptera frugiperda multiple nucleopolyhedrovirus]